MTAEAVQAGDVAGQAVNQAGAVVNADPLLTAGQAGIYLGLADVHKDPGQAVRALCRKGRLRFVRIGERVMVRRSWLEEFIESRSNAVRKPRRNRGA